MARGTAAGVAEQADATVSNTVEGNLVRVQVSSPAPVSEHIGSLTASDAGVDTGRQSLVTASQASSRSLMASLCDGHTTGSWTADGTGAAVYGCAR